MNKTIFTTIAVITCLLATSQEVLTLDRAFELALANNYDIRVLSLQKAMADNSATVGNAGLLPSVTANANAGINVNNTSLEFAGGLPPTEVDNAQSTNTGAGIQANYVLFNGLNGTRTLQKLKMNTSAVELQSQAAIEATLLQVANAYYVLARSIDQVRIAEENLTVTQKRFERVKLAKELGTALQTEYLSARVDMTTDSSAFLNAELQRNQAMRQLEQLLIAELDQITTTEKLDVELQSWTEDALINQAKENNASIKNAQLQLELAEKDYQLAWSSAFPTLSLSGGYSFNSQQNEAGIVLSNTASGWNGSIALSYPLFNGFRNNIQRQNQKLTQEIRELEVKKQEVALETDISNAFESYTQSQVLADFEEKNLESAVLNLERVNALWSGGQITSTQLREAQVAFTQSQVRYSNALISIKLNELEIMRLTGQILKQE